MRKGGGRGLDGKRCSGMCGAGFDQSIWGGPSKKKKGGGSIWARRRGCGEEKARRAGVWARLGHGLEGGATRGQASGARVCRQVEKKEVRLECMSSWHPGD